MPTLQVFITLATILAFVLAFIVLVPWLRKLKSTGDNQLIALNIEVFQERIQELQADFDKGLINETAFINQKTELERQLLQVSQEQLNQEQLSLLDDTATDASSTHLDSQKDTDVTNKQQTQASQLTQSTSTTESPTQLTTKPITKSTAGMMSYLTILVCIPLLMGFMYVLAKDTAPIAELWKAEDKMGKVADDLLTGAIDTPPEWATQDNMALLSAIQTNVHQHAHDANRWLRLSDIYMAFGAKEQAYEAISRAYRLSPSDEAIAVRFAQTQFFVTGDKLNADGYQALRSVLQHNPDHQGAQMLMIMGEARNGNYDAAQQWIEKLKASIGKKEGDHSTALNSLEELSQSIATSKAAALSNAATTATDSSAEATAQTPTTTDEQMTSSTQAQATQSQSTHMVQGDAVELTVNIDAQLQPLITESDVLFVTVQDSTGGAPLAVKRLQATELQHQKSLMLILSDTDAMMPEHTLSKAIEAGKSLVVTARVSKSGQAMSASGDLTSGKIALDAVADNTTNNGNTKLKIAITINQQVP